MVATFGCVFKIVCYGGSRGDFVGGILESDGIADAGLIVYGVSGNHPVCIGLVWFDLLAGEEP